MKKDSITVTTIASLPKDYSNILSKVYSKGIDARLYNRIDSIKYDYVFIQETLRMTDSTFTIIEKYYKSQDTIPFLVYFNGEIVANYYDDYKFTLKDMLRKYHNLKPIQTLFYEKEQGQLHVCMGQGRSKKEFIRQRKLDLKNTYQIQSFIDKKLMLVNVSVQTPAKNPKFTVVRIDL